MQRTFAASEDARAAATTRQERVDQIRNADIRRAVWLITQHRRTEALSLMAFTVWSQASLQGIGGLTLGIQQ